MRNLSDKSCKENRNTHFIFNNFFFPENLAFYEIMWKNILYCLAGTDDSMAHALSCWKTKDTSTHSEYVVHFAFPPQQWLHESVLMLPPPLLPAVATFALSFL
jgi:hypothetical protein